MLNDKKDTSPMNEINSFKFEENIFNKEFQEIPKKKGKGKKPKAIDFMEYAESKGIQINIQYEDKTNQATFYNKDKKEFSKPFEQKRTNKPYNKDDKRKPKEDNIKKNDIEYIEGHRDQKEKIDYNAFKFDDNYSNQRNYDNNNNYYNNDNDYYDSRYKRNFYPNNNTNNIYEDYNNYYNKKIKNQIAVEIPDPSDLGQNVYGQQNNMMNNQNKSGMFTKVNKFDKSQYMFPQDQNMMNFQAMMMRNNVFNPMAMPMNPFMPPQQIYPVRDEEILDVIEFLFSPKNLNRDIYLRESMDINGWVNAEIVIMHPSRQLKMMNVTLDRIIKIIDNIGSDYVEKRILPNKLDLRAKKYDDFKAQLMSINDIKQKLLSQLPPQPITPPMTQPIRQAPMGFTPPPMFTPMMNMYMQRPPIDPLMFQQMRNMNMIPPNGQMTMMPMQNPQNDSN